jgi:hypothetical protein
MNRFVGVIVFLLLIFGGSSLQAQKRVSIPSKSLPDMDLVEISLAPGAAERFVLAAPAETVIKVALDVDNADGSGFLKLVNGDRSVDKWVDDFNGIETLTGREGDYIFEVKNTSRKTYQTRIYFSFDRKEKYLGLSSRDVPMVKNIHEVDFSNFIYEPVWAGDVFERIQVCDGEYSDKREYGTVTLHVDAPVYDDIDGDGRDEAIVNSVYGGGGTGYFSEAFVYTLKNKRPRLMTKLAGGDRAFGGIRKIKAKNGMVKVEYNDAGDYGTACCTEFILSIDYRWNGRELVEYRKTRRSLYPTARVLFDRGAVRKTIEVAAHSSMDDGEDGRRFVLRARKGQVLMVTTNSDEVSAYLVDGDAEIRTTATGFTAILKNDGDYTFHIRNKQPREIVIPIDVKIL